MYVEAYDTLYTGHTKIMRLLFISDQCSDNLKTQLDALRLAFDETRKGQDTAMFREVVQKINGRLGTEYKYDVDWHKAVEQRKAKLEKK